MVSATAVECQSNNVKHASQSTFRSLRHREYRKATKSRRDHQAMSIFSHSDIVIYAKGKMRRANDSRRLAADRVYRDG